MSAKLKAIWVQG